MPFATYLPRGTHEYIYFIRASIPGEYRAIPIHAYEMYFPEVFGRNGSRTAVKQTVLGQKISSTGAYYDRESAPGAALS